MVEEAKYEELLFSKTSRFNARGEGNLPSMFNLYFV